MIKIENREIELDGNVMDIAIEYALLTRYVCKFCKAHGMSDNSVELMLKETISLVKMSDDEIS